MTLDDLVDRLNGIDATTVLIDGRSGSGKSTLADELHRRWPSSMVVRLDDIYPGWDGLAWAARHVGAELLAPRAAGRPGRWRQWNWTTGTPRRWHTVEPGRRLILEGVGALSPAHRALADLGIWVDAPDELRKIRALRRDGGTNGTYAPHWDRWAAQEHDRITGCDPVAAADYVATEAAGGRWSFADNRPGLP